MKSKEFIIEGRNHPVIVVDVQPDYCYGQHQSTCKRIIDFVVKQTGPVLMFVNAEESGVSNDTLEDIYNWWDEIAGIDHERLEYDEEYNGPIDWKRFTVVDKGYGHFRSWMDRGDDPSIIIKVIREMYMQKVNDSRDLYDGENSSDYDEDMRQLIGKSFREFDLDDPLIVNWTSVAQLKQFDGAYIVGGGRNQCLREVELLMNAFNIRYKRIDSLVYG